MSKEDTKELEVSRKNLKTKIDENRAVFNNLEKYLATAKKEFNQCKASGANANQENRDVSKCDIINNVESSVLKRHRSSKAFYVQETLRGMMYAG